jgi:hypothetical protein
LSNMEARKNAQLIQAVMEHIKEHETVYYTTEPALLMLLGQKPPMAPPPPDIQPPGAPPPPTPGSPPGTPPPPLTETAEVAKPVGNPAAENQPRLPTNPQTKEQFQPGAIPTPPTQGQ